MSFIQIDRFEGDFAVCYDDGLEKSDIKMSELPRGVKEGDVLTLDGRSFYLDKEETLRRKYEVLKLFKKLTASPDKPISER